MTIAHMQESLALSKPEPLSASYRWVAASIIVLGSIASILSSTVVNVAVPTLQQAFHASLTDVQWIATAYLLGLSAVIPISGWVSDRFGTKRTYIATLALFVVTSFLCGFATSTGTEIALRVAQGMAGGMVMPVGMTMLMHLTPPRERGRVMGVIGIPMMVAPALGPTVAGWLLEHFSWPSIFWINIPFSVLALAFAALKLRESARVQAGPLDVVGLLLCTPAVTIFIYGVTKAAETGWGSAAALAPMLAGVGLSVVFVFWELRRQHPLLELRVFRDAAYSASISVSILVAAGMFGAMFALPVFMQQVQGYSALDAGWVMAAQGIGSILSLPVSGWLTDRYGARPVVLAGVCGLILVTFTLAHVQPETTKETWALILVGRGLASGFTMMPAFSAAYVTLPAVLISRGTALSNTMQRMASSLGVAVTATVIAERVNFHLAHAAASASLASHAVAHGFDDALLVTTGITMLGLPVTILLRRALPAGEHAHPKLPRPYRFLAVALSAVAMVGLLLTLVAAFSLA
jgi:EmrB/QacA subfamily drug resistance transporter